MNVIDPFDIVVIAILVVMTLRGGLKGVISQTASIIALVAGWFIASRFCSVAAPYISTNSVWGKHVTMLVLFLGTGIGIKLVSGMFQRITQLIHFKEFDRQMGAIFGFLKGVILCMILTYFAVTLNDTTRLAVVHSQSGTYLVKAICAIEYALPDDARHEFVKKSLEDFKNTASSSGLSVEREGLTKDLNALKDKLRSQVTDPETGEPVKMAQQSGSSSGSSGFSSWFSSSNKSTPVSKPVVETQPDPLGVRQETRNPFDELAQDVVQSINQYNYQGFQVEIPTSGSNGSLQISSVPNSTGGNSFQISSPRSQGSLNVRANPSGGTTIQYNSGNYYSSGSFMSPPSSNPQNIAPSF